MPDKELLWVRVFRGALWLIQASVMLALVGCAGILALPLVALLFGFI